jgi:HEAT repeat protein
VGEDSTGALRRLANHSDATLRIIAVFGFQKLPADVAVPELSQMLNDSDEDVRLQAATSLAFISSPAATTALCNAAKSESTLEAAAAIAALARLPTDKVLATLCDAAQDRRPFLRAQAVESLGELLTGDESQPSQPCEPLGRLIECLDDQGKFDGCLALEREIEKAAQAASRSNKMVGAAFATSEPLDRSVGAVTASILEKKTGLSIKADPSRTHAEREALASACRDAINKPQNFRPAPGSSPTTTQSR